MSAVAGQALGPGSVGAGEVRLAHHHVELTIHLGSIAPGRDAGGAGGRSRATLDRVGSTRSEAARRWLGTVILAVATGLTACSYSTESTLQQQGAAPTFASTTTVPLAPTTTTTLPPTDHPLGEESTVFVRGIGDVFVGMTLPEASAAAGFPLVPVDPDDQGRCHRVRPEGGPGGVVFVVVDGVVATVEVDHPDISTRSGAGVGSTAEEITELFPTRIEEETGETGEDLLVFVPTERADADVRVVFVLDDDEVVRYRAGRLPEVAQADPCT